jgi:branched-chain amino acid transport system ATP-binding protein
MAVARRPCASLSDTMHSDIILQTRGLTKEFRGFVAVNDVNLSVRRGAIHALIGPNGAGKTTVFNLLTKFHIPTRGQIVYDGVDITGERPAQTARRGIVRSFQISAVFAQLSVRENVRVALQRKLGVDYCFWRSERSLERLHARVEELLDQVGLRAQLDVAAGDLPYGRKRTLEIATTLALEPELLLLDEPTQGMGHEDVDRVKHLIKQVSAGRSILMVEHNMKVVADICDTITVLQRGEILAEGPYAEVSTNPAVREAYMGAEDE